jgi:hypothetical protein
MVAQQTAAQAPELVSAGLSGRDDCRHNSRGFELLGADWCGAWFGFRMVGGFEMNKFTPGPWGFNQAKGKVLACLSMAGKLLIFKNKISDQDGQLISAAPDLLQALEDSIIALEIVYPNGSPVLNAARAAIAKARGEA